MHSEHAERISIVAADVHMIVDVVDDGNQRAGVAERGSLLERGLNFRTVHILLFASTGRLILQRLRPNHPRSPAKLGSSVAGYLAAGESYEGAAHRKLRKELGINAALRYLGETTMLDERSRKFIGVFVGHLGQGAPRPRPETETIEELLDLPIEIIDRMTAEAPEKFTDTFLVVYGFFRSRDR